MIETFKIVTGIYDTVVNPNMLAVGLSYATRGHNFRLIRARYDLQKYYFTNRVVNMWNYLSSYVVSAESVNCFKNRPDNFWKNLANKFSQCTFSIAEHYDLFSGLIILRQA